MLFPFPMRPEFLSGFVSYYYGHVGHVEVKASLDKGRHVGGRCSLGTAQQDNPVRLAGYDQLKYSWRCICSDDRPSSTFINIDRNGVAGIGAELTARKF